MDEGYVYICGCCIVLIIIGILWSLLSPEPSTTYVPVETVTHYIFYY